ncbi:MAG TPA: trehalose-6-phosphate synthase [Angustibacter sp.]|nr:trehalose-6-phosphate synthase [Angustibacter sp.]
MSPTAASSKSRSTSSSPDDGELTIEPTPDRPTYDLVVVANRLPVDRVTDDDGNETWQQSPGGLVTAMQSVMTGGDGAWVGWSGDPGEAPEPFDADGLHLHAVGLTRQEVEDHYEGMSNDTLWPLYHDVIVPPRFRRRWFDGYRAVNRRFAQAAARLAAPGATVWVHDYQLQLVPAMLRALRPDVRIGWFNHIPFPPVELFAQLPWRRAIVEGLLGADLLGFQRRADAENFLRVCRRLLALQTRSDTVTVRTHDGEDRVVRATSFPISIDSTGLEELARRPETLERARQIRHDLGDPDVVLLGVDRLDYTKGIRHRLKAYEELLADGVLAPPKAVFVQVATPSRERVQAYQQLREQVEVTVGRANGDYGQLGQPAIHYLHQSFPREEMAAMFLAADVMLVTPLRDGMNLVAKEYVTCRYDQGGALVLSEFTGAAGELDRAFICNPHDIDGLKLTIREAIDTDPREKARRMRTMRRRVREYDVQRWADHFLQALAAAPERP